MQIKIMPKISINEAAKLLEVSLDTRSALGRGRQNFARTRRLHARRRYDVATLFFTKINITSYFVVIPASPLVVLFKISLTGEY